MVDHVPADATFVSEFSRKIDIATVKDRHKFVVTVSATPEECVALAKRYAVSAVDHLKADITIKPVGNDLFRVSYTIDAAVVQPCGQTLVPVTQIIQETDEELLTTSVEALTPLEEAESLDNVPTELIIGDMIDYGEIIVQIVALVIDPFPRAADAPIINHIEHEHNPFAALQALKPGNKGQRSND